MVIAREVRSPTPNWSQSSCCVVQPGMQASGLPPPPTASAVLTTHPPTRIPPFWPFDLPCPSVCLRWGLLQRHHPEPAVRESHQPLQLQPLRPWTVLQRGLNL